jgi:membrane-associated phospholipid phosphatase
MSRLLQRGSGDHALSGLAYIALGVAVIVGALWASRHLAPLAALLWRLVERLLRRITQTRPFRSLAARYPRLWPFVARRVSPGEYLGLHLTLGLLVSLGAVALFAALAQDVVNREALFVFDQQLADCLHELVTPTGLSIWVVVSELGSVTGVALVAIAFGIVLYRRRQVWLFRGWLAALGGAAVLNVVLKQFFQRPRPAYAEFFELKNWSFPSGHAMGSLVTYGMLAYIGVVLIRRQRVRWIVVGLAAFLIFAIGASRIVLGVHYLSDVLGGYAAGSVWLAACISGLEIIRRRPRPEPATKD